MAKKKKRLIKHILNNEAHCNKKKKKTIKVLLMIKVCWEGATFGFISKCSLMEVSNNILLV